MNTQETTRPASNSRKPKWVRDCQQHLVRFLGGYTKADLKEAVKVSADCARLTGDEDLPNGMVDVCGWHWNKFGTRYDT